MLMTLLISCFRVVLLHLVFNVEDGCEELEREIEEGVAEGGGVYSLYVYHRKESR